MPEKTKRRQKSDYEWKNWLTCEAKIIMKERDTFKEVMSVLFTFILASIWLSNCMMDG